MRRQRATGSAAPEYVLVISVVVVAVVGASYTFVPDFQNGVQRLGTDVGQILSGGSIGSVGVSGDTVGGLSSPAADGGVTVDSNFAGTNQAIANDSAVARTAGVGGNDELGIVAAAPGRVNVGNTCGQYAIAMVTGYGLRDVIRTTFGTGKYTRSVEVANTGGQLCAMGATCSLLTPLMSLTDVKGYLSRNSAERRTHDPRISTATGFDDLRQSISDGRPAIVVIGNAEQGHIVTLVETRTSRAESTVTYEDAAGRHTVPYSTFDESWKSHGRQMLTVNPSRS